MSTQYDITIGLEVHVQLKTKSKIFCSCSTEFGSTANSQTCPICLGFPGVLPVLNRRVLELALRVAFALECQMTPRMKFDRKNYFYPDLPKNFQISQFDLPMAAQGKLEVPLADKNIIIRIQRIHLEEDAGKLIHKPAGSGSLADFNRSGVPLIEIVSEPDLTSPDQAHAYLEQLKAILQYLEVSDCDMEKGSLRCDANISLKPHDRVEYGTKVEIKNMNTFKGIRVALTYEVVRQSALLDRGDRIVQETRLWDAEAEVTRSMRSKEEAHDYRYFPEPDLVPFQLTPAILEEVRKNLPELPRQRKERIIQQYGLSEYDAGVLTREKAIADYFERCIQLYPKPKVVANWIMTELLAQVRQRNVSIQELGCKPEWLAEMLELMDHETLSGKMAKEILIEVVQTGQSPKHLISQKGFVQISDGTLINQMIEQVIQNNPRSVQDYTSGKTNAMMFLVGQVMKMTQGKANPGKVQELLLNRLNSKEGSI